MLGFGLGWGVGWFVDWGDDINYHMALIRVLIVLSYECELV